MDLHVMVAEQRDGVVYRLVVGVMELLAWAKMKVVLA
jgi:hypothetical protein